jgi:hypothetical protein
VAEVFIKIYDRFRPAEARMLAEERIIKQLTDKTNMSLGLINSNH